MGLSHLSARGPRMKAPQRKPNMRTDMVACLGFRLIDMVDMVMKTYLKPDIRTDMVACSGS